MKTKILTTDSTDKDRSDQIVYYNILKPIRVILFISVQSVVKKQNNE